MYKKSLLILIMITRGNFAFAERKENSVDFYNTLGIITLRRNVDNDENKTPITTLKPSVNIDYHRMINNNFDLSIASGLSYLNFSRIKMNQSFYGSSFVTPTFVTEHLRFGPTFGIKQVPSISGTSTDTSARGNNKIRYGLNLTYSYKDFVAQTKTCLNKREIDQEFNFRKKMKIYGIDSFFGINQAFNINQKEQVNGTALILGISFSN